MNEIIKPEKTEHAGKFERIERFQSITAGQYCVAREAVPEEAIQGDDTLLILRVDWVDNVPHTIVLRSHPRIFGKEVTVPGSKWKKTFTQHKFLLKDFLAIFEHQPSDAAEAVRRLEQQQAQAGIAALQQEMLDAQTDPAIMARIVAEGLAKEREQSGEPEPTSLPAIRSSALPPLTLGSALATGVTESSIQALRTQATHQQSVATIKANWLKSKTEQISSAIKAMMPFFEEGAAAALAATSEMRDHVAKIIQGIASLDLFIGKDVEVIHVRKGASAASDIPLSIVQRKLIMLEELAVYAEVTENSDYFNSQKRFFHILEHEPGLTEQIFPTERCVVCMCSTRYELDYDGDGMFERAIKNAYNKKVYLLVRDGDNVYYVSSPIETHLKAARLFPTLDETNRIFTGYDGTAITFESLSYTNALSSFERQALHYKRLLILLCGLDFRLSLFGKFYEGDKGLDFVSMEFQKNHMRFISDDDEATMIEGGQRVMPVLKWLKQANSYLTSGSRVFGIWGDLVSNERSCPGGTRIGARYEGEPDVRVAMTYDGSPCVDLPALHFKKSVNVKVFPGRYRKSDDYFDESLPVPYLVLDTIEPEELSTYIHDRRSRIESVRYISLFKSALAFVQAERAAERAAREYIRETLISTGIVEADKALNAVNHGIRLWRAANRGQALPVLADLGSKEWSQLLDVLYLFQHGAGAQLERVTTFAAELGYSPVELRVTGKAQLVLYVEPAESERDDRLTPHVWFHRIVLRLGKNKISEQSRSWSRGYRSAAEHLLHQFKDATDVRKTFCGFESYEQKQQLYEACEASLQTLRQLAADEGAQKLLADDFLEHRKQYLTGRGKPIPDIGIAYPIGLCLEQSGSRQQVRVIAFGTHEAQGFIQCLGSNSAALDGFAFLVANAYARKQSHIYSMALVADRRLMSTAASVGLLTKREALKCVAEPLQTGLRLSTWERVESSYSLDETLANGIQKSAKSGSVTWLAGGLEAKPGRGLDSMFGIEGRVKDLLVGHLSIHTGSLETEHAKVFVETPSNRESWPCTGYSCTHFRLWLSTEGRAAAFEEMHRLYPELRPESEVKEKYNTHQSTGECWYLTKANSETA